MQVNGIPILRDPREIAHAFENETEIAADLETSGLSPYTDKIAVVSLYGDKTGALGVFHGRGYMPDEIKQLLESPKSRKTYHNGVSFDIPFLMAAGVKAADPPLYDTLVGAGVALTNGRRDNRKTLQAEVERRLGVHIKKGADHSSWMNANLDENQLLYCAEDLLHIHALRREQEKKVASYQATSALELEMAIVGSVARMTFNGLPLSLPALDDYRRTNYEYAVTTKAELEGEFGPFNVNSAAQIKTILGDMGMKLPLMRDAKTGQMKPSTRAELLNAVVARGPAGLVLNGYVSQRDGEEPADFTARSEHTLVILEKIVKLREATKAVGFYDENWLAEHMGPGRRIHARFWQTGTDTLRFSSTGPNLQQWPKRMRGVIGGLAGHDIVSCDYSQIEVVIAAWLAQDEVLLDVIEKGGDIHTWVASLAMGIPIESVTPHLRKVFKAANFGLIFGGGAKMFMDYALQYGAILTLKEAQDISDMYFRRFQGLARMKQEAYAMAKSGRNMIEMRMQSGAVRHLIGASLGPTTILNTRVQGNAAAGMKFGILEARKAGLDQFLGATVHDELIGVVDKRWSADYAEALQAAMIRGMSKIVDCTVRAEPAIGTFWS